MKKAAAKTKKTTRKTSKPILAFQPIFFQRVIVIASCLVIAVVAFVFTNKQQLDQAVAGASIAQGLFMQSTVKMPVIPGAVSYNIYYKAVGAEEYTNAVRNVSPTTHFYIISYLKKSTSYEYRVGAVDAFGREFYFTPAQPLTNLQDM